MSDEHPAVPRTADENRKWVLAFLKKYPDCEIYDSLGRTHFFSRKYGMVCAVDDITAGLIDLEPFVEIGPPPDGELSA